MKRVSKSEAERLLKDTDPLEIVIEQIHRSDTASVKLILLSRFSTEVQKLIKEERDIFLIAVKIK
jgi:hypothetical protein